MGNNSAEMPKYKCHKEVWALKIDGIRVEEDDVFILPANTAYGEFSVGLEYWNKHKPVIGGYYVVYGDGYKSFSPAEAFESGYTLIEK